MPTIQLETIIHTDDVKLVFDLSRSIDLHKVSTKHTNEEAIASVTSGLIGRGESVTWRAKHFGIYQTLTSKITTFERPNYFVDEQASGAFQSFRHEYYFEEHGTKMLDVFNYTSPLGILGRLADVLLLKRYMTQLLIKRNEVIKEYAEAEKWREVVG